MRDMAHIPKQAHTRLAQESAAEKAREAPCGAESTRD